MNYRKTLISFFCHPEEEAQHSLSGSLNQDMSQRIHSTMPEVTVSTSFHARLEAANLGENHDYKSALSLEDDVSFKVSNALFIIHNSLFNASGKSWQ